MSVGKNKSNTTKTTSSTPATSSGPKHYLVWARQARPPSCPVRRSVADFKLVSNSTAGKWPSTECNRRLL
jgi:hypothetical protein